MVISAEYDDVRHGYFSIAYVFEPFKPEGRRRRYERCSALWDTGAGVSCISTSLAERLGLPTHPRDTGFFGISGTDFGKNYGALLAIRNDEGGYYKMPYIFQGFNEQNIGDRFDVIIGIDLIEDGRLVIDKINGRPTLTFTIDNDIEKR